MRKALAVAAALFFFLFCGYFAYSQKPKAAKKESPEGWWILSDYQDNIIVSKKIGKYSQTVVPCWQAILIHVSSDTLCFFGSVLFRAAFPRNDRGDTLRNWENGIAPMIFRFDTAMGRVVVSWTEKDGTVHKSGKYRRLRKNELALTEGLPGSQSSAFQLSKNYSAWFMKYLLSGSYRSLADSSKMLLLRTNGTISGFGKWNRYSVDNFFGTCHYHNSLDCITFMDTVPRSSYQGKDSYKLTNTDKGEMRRYNWSFSGDTLILRPFIGYDIETEVLGKERLLFLKAKKQ